MSSNKLPELSFPTDTSLVDLPSHGKFYLPDHPLHQQQCAELIHMRGVEEDILTNRDYIKKEVAIDKLLQSLFCDSRLKEDRFYSKILFADQSAMILKTRIAAYTSDYPVTVICPRCKESVRYKFDLSKYTVKEPDYESDPNVMYNESDNTFSIKIPNTEITVKVVLATVGYHRKVKNKILNKKRKELTNKELYEDLIVSINEVSDLKLVDTFFKEIPAFYLKWLKTVLDDINPSISLVQDFTCEYCGHQDEIEPPFTTDFLFPQKLERKMKIASQE
jgi:hypothetical protein